MPAPARVLTAVIALSGCAGSRGSPSHAAQASPADAGAADAPAVVVRKAGPCVETVSVISSSQSTALGFSADDVLAATGGAHNIDLAWLPETLYATHSRSGTHTSFTFTLAPTPTTVRFIDSQGGGCPDRGEGVGEPCLVCSSRMEIDIGLALLTGDGALDEQVNVTLITMGGEVAWFRTDIAAADVGGSYLGGITPNAGYRLVGIHLEAGFDKPFGGARNTVRDEWNGFVAAQLLQGKSTNPIWQAHGYFPRRTWGR